jgi:hypothetical protein
MHVNMTEKIAMAAVATTPVVAGYQWIGTANDIATLVVTIIAAFGGIAALLFHVERYRKLRKERKERE